MTSPPAARVFAALLWTAAFGAVLFGVDRLVHGPIPDNAWHAAASLDDLPDAASILEPSFLPEGLVWPPEAVFYRQGDDAGWWWGVRDAADPTRWLWVGHGTNPLSDPLSPVLGCLAEHGCPDGWVALSRDAGSATVTLIAPADFADASRVLEHLR